MSLSSLEIRRLLSLTFERFFFSLLMSKMAQMREVVRTLVASVIITLGERYALVVMCNVTVPVVCAAEKIF